MPNHELDGADLPCYKINDLILLTFTFIALMMGTLCIRMCFVYLSI
jgi:hypothetical protein